MQEGKQLEKSDNGEQANSLITSIDIKLLIQKLPIKDKKIVKMIIDGYNQKDIIRVLKTNYPYIARLKKRLIVMITK